MTHVSEGRRASLLFWSKCSTVALTGIFLSVVLHELFHIVVHWGGIVSIKLFPDARTIVEINSLSTHQYNTDLEELLAYSITVATLLVTTIIICRMYDKKDSRSFSRSVLPKSSSMRDLTDAQLIELAYKTGVFK